MSTSPALKVNFNAKNVMSLVTKPIFGNRSESRCLRRFLTFLSQFLNLLIRDLSEIGFIS